MKILITKSVFLAFLNSLFISTDLFRTRPAFVVHNRLIFFEVSSFITIQHFYLLTCVGVDCNLYKPWEFIPL